MTEVLKELKDGETMKVECEGCDWVRVILKKLGKLVIEDESDCLVHRKVCVVTRVEQLNRH